jgi:heptosyltransferase-2
MTLVETAPLNTTSASDINLAACRSILVAKLDRIGDFILASPFLRGLRHSAPNARINLFVTPEVFPLAETCPYVDRVLSVTSVNGTPQMSGTSEKIVHGLMDDFRTGNFDLTVTPRWDYDFWDASALCTTTGAKHRVGFAVPSAYQDKPQYSSNFSATLHRPFAAHEVEHNLALLEFMGGAPQGDELELWMLPQEMEEATNRLAKLSGDGPIVAVCPGASLARKTLPTRKLLSILARVKSEVPQIRFLVMGQNAERPAADVLTKELPDTFSFCGETNIRQTVAIIASTRALIGMDSGPGHIAAAADVPVAVFSCFGKNGNPIVDCSPVRWRPRGSRESLVIQPEVALWPCTSMCVAGTHHCTTSILEEESAQAITGLVKRAINA